MALEKHSSTQGGISRVDGYLTEEGGSVKSLTGTTSSFRPLANGPYGFSPRLPLFPGKAVDTRAVAGGVHCSRRKRAVWLPWIGFPSPGKNRELFCAFA